MYSCKLLTYYIELAKAPVSETKFAGEDVRFSPEFEAVEAELAKDSSLHHPGRTDWSIVRQAAETLLRDKSKDLRVAVWLVWSLTQLEAVAGLVAGIGMLRYLCQHHWAQVYPVKQRTRAGAFAWLLPRLEQALSDAVPVKEQLPLLRALVEQLTALDENLTQRMGDDAPLLLPIRRRLLQRVESASEGKPEPNTLGGAVAQVKQAASQLLAPGAGITNEKDAHRELRALQDGGRALCNWWLRQKATDVRALRLGRVLTWLQVAGLPEHNAARVTGLRAPSQDRLNDYRQRFEAGKYADLLVDVETSLAKAPFWLDGHRLAWECLEKLGAEAGMREVEAQCALFLQGLPGLADLSYHDGQPFADAATRAWIASAVLPQLQRPINPSRPADTDPNPGLAPWDRALEDVQPELRNNGLRAAVQAITEEMHRAGGGRERFFWQFTLARLCHQAKKYELARIQLEALDQALHSAGIHTWEPDLALQVLHLLHNCCELLPQSHTIRERREEVYRRLCHLDLEVVIE